MRWWHERTTNPRALRRPRVRLCAVDDHLSRSGLLRHGRPDVGRRVVARQRGRSEVGVHRLRHRVCLVRDPNGLARRRLGAPRHVVADRHLVVDIYGADRRGGIEGRFLRHGRTRHAGGAAVSVRRGGGGGISQHHACRAQLVSLRSSGHGAGLDLDVGAIDGGTYAHDLDAAGGRNCLDAGARHLARGVCAVWFDRRRVVRRLRVVLPRSPARSSEGQRRRTDRN